MRSLRVIPVLLIKNQKLVKTVRFVDPQYVGDPINALHIFNDKEVDELMILDIGDGSGTPDIDFIRVLCSECFMPLSIGGNISTLQQARQIISMGAEKVVLGRAATTRRALIGEIAREFGSQAITVSVDVSTDWLGRPRVFVNHGTKNTGLNPVQYARMAESEGAGELLIQSIRREGTRSGYDLHLVQEVSSAVSIPVVASGGASSLQDFYEAGKNGASAVAAGSMFVYHGLYKAVLINYPSQEELNEHVFQRL